MIGFLIQRVLQALVVIVAMSIIVSGGMVDFGGGSRVCTLMCVGSAVPNALRSGPQHSLI